MFRSIERTTVADRLSINFSADDTVFSQESMHVNEGNVKIHALNLSTHYPAAKTNFFLDNIKSVPFDLFFMWHAKFYSWQ